MDLSSASEERPVDDGDKITMPSRIYKRRSKDWERENTEDNSVPISDESKRDEGVGMGPILTIGSSKRASQDDIPKNYYVKPPG